MSEVAPLDVLVLSHEEVAALLDTRLVLEATREVFIAEAQGLMGLGPAAPMPVSAQGWLMAMPGTLSAQGVAGVKWGGYYERDQADPTPTNWGNILLLNRVADGLPYALLECTDITAWRTAGGHAVFGALTLARKDASRLAVLGTGVQAEAGIRAFDEVFDLSQITVYSRSAAHRDAFVERLSPDLRAPLKAVSDPRLLAEDADILLTCSSAETPVISAEWITPGTTVVAVSAFHDLDPALTNRVDKWFLGNATSDVEHIIELPKFKADVDASNVTGTIGEVLTEKIVGREHDDEIILFSHMGMGTLDVALGAKLYERARAKGLGTTLRLAG
jgi:ornithine cyclodeaminase/alanine dehydrogenase-like protein (mu-crystallin family)